MTVAAAGRERSRALFVAPSAYPLGGVATWLDALLPGLRERGWNVTLGLLSGTHHDVDRYRAIHPDDRICAIENRGGSREGRVRALARTFERIRPDLVVSVNVADAEEAVWRIRARGGAGPRLATTQHALQRDFFDHLRDRHDAVDGVVCTNRLTTVLATRYSGVPAERVHYAPYGVSMKAPERIETIDRRLRIAWAGRIESTQKRALDLPLICRALEDRKVGFELTVVGSGPAEGELRSALASRTERGQVRWAGFMKPEEVGCRALATCDLLLVTSAWETGPIVAWEAAVAGLGVVSSDFLGRRLEGALVEGETAWIYPVGDASLAARALEFASDPTERARRSMALLSAVSQRYSLESSAAAWAAALGRIVSEPPATGFPSDTHPREAGRLDRLLGARYGESVRRLLGVRHPQATAGAEWPHAYGEIEPGEFAELSRRLDAGEEALET
jgi:glycosyltransferase involved in cell wall biosynthesis